MREHAGGGERDADTGALPQPACERDPAAVGLAEALYNCKTKPCALLGSHHIMPPLSESREDAHLIARIDSDAGIPHPEHDLPGCGKACKHADLAARGRE